MIKTIMESRIWQEKLFEKQSLHLRAAILTIAYRLSAEDL